MYRSVKFQHICGQKKHDLPRYILVIGMVYMNAMWKKITWALQLWSPKAEYQK